MLDCGPGVLSRYQKYVGTLSRIGTVILSHLHFDHMSDVTVLRYAASSSARYEQLPQHVSIYAPSEPEREFNLLTYKDATSGHAISCSSVLQVGDLRVSFHPGVHAISSYAVRVEGPEGVFAYSGDSRPCPGLVEAARGAGLFLCEASGIEADSDYVASGHLTARQAGEIGVEAGVGKLLLTHIWPLYNEDQLLDECRVVFPDARIAQEGVTYRI